MQISFTKPSRKQVAIIIAAIAVLSAGVFFFFHRGKIAPTVSSNCSLSPFTSRFLGFSLDYLLCEGETSLVLRPVGNTLYLVAKDKAGNPVYYGKPVIDTFNKKADESIEVAMQAQFGLRAGCAILPATDSGITDDTKQVFKLIPDAGTNACGEHASNGVSQYIEYHPEESKTRYLLVRRGGSLGEAFDKNSIRFLPDDEVSAARNKNTSRPIRK